MRTSKFALYAAETSNALLLATCSNTTKASGPAAKSRLARRAFRRYHERVDRRLREMGGGKVTDSEMGLVVDGYRPPHRNDLDDNDSTTWEKEDDGALKDPWQKATMLPFVRVDPPNEVFTFSTATVGGEGAIAVRARRTAGLPKASDNIRSCSSKATATFTRSSRTARSLSRSSRSWTASTPLRSTPLSLKNAAARPSCRPTARPRYRSAQAFLADPRRR